MKRNNVKQITIRLTADEYAHVKQLSKDSGLKMEPAIRRLIMGVNLRPRPPDELPELLRQLSGIGTNINQIAKVANASGYVRKEDIQSIMEMQAALWRAVKRGYWRICSPIISVLPPGPLRYRVYPVFETGCSLCCRLRFGEQAHVCIDPSPLAYRKFLRQEPVDADSK